MLFTRWFSSFLTLVLASWKEPGKFHPLTLPSISSLQGQENVHLPVFSQPFPCSGACLALHPQIPENPNSVSRWYISSITLTKWLNVHNKSCNFYEPWAGVPWHVLAVKFQCVLVRMFPACVYSWSHHTSWDCLCGFAQLLTQVSEDMGESGGRLQDPGLKKWPQWLCTSETLKLPTHPCSWKVPEYQLAKNR